MAISPAPIDCKELMKYIISREFYFENMCIKNTGCKLRNGSIKWEFTITLKYDTFKVNITINELHRLMHSSVKNIPVIDKIVHTWRNEFLNATTGDYLS